MLDGNGRELSALLPRDKLNALVQKLPRATAAKVVRTLQSEIETRLRGAEELAGAQFEREKAAAGERLAQTLDGEITRLKALRALNPAVREDEISALEAQREEAMTALKGAALSLQALRLIVTR